MNQVTVRPAIIDDLEPLLTFEQEIISAERPFDPTIRSGCDVHYYDLAALMSSPDAEVLVAEFADNRVGLRSNRYFRRLSEAFASFLPRIHVCCTGTPRKDINGMIVDELEAWSRSHGVTEMQLEVYAANAAAIKAYEKAGYEPLILTMRKGLKKESNNP